MNRKNYKKELFEKYNKECVYCATKLDNLMMATIEHFYPKSIYPTLEFDSDNIVLSCPECNMLKDAKFPLDDMGKALLIHPIKENFSDHIIQLKNGYFEGKTERGQITIDILKLNRSSLIEQRVLDMIDMQFDNIVEFSDDEIYTTFKENIQKINVLNLLKLENQETLEDYMKYMLYANTITALETYLCDRFVVLVQSENKHLRNFVGSFKDFKKEKFIITDIFSEYDGITNKSNNAMKDVLYHDLPKVSGMYRDTFGIQFPQFSEVYKSILIRHDLVHRNGKTKNGDFYIINKESIIDVIDRCIVLVDSLEDELRQLV